ncbi:hypothetical protein AcV7_005790 [Taiwanofungus camphoratus]|nr:hypothetical protein AcV7_005790 [Antrodia cinnamomea]
MGGREEGEMRFPFSCCPLYMTTSTAHTTASPALAPTPPSAHGDWGRWLARDCAILSRTHRRDMARASTVTANRSGASRRAPGWSHARSQGARDPGTGRIWKLRAYNLAANPHPPRTPSALAGIRSTRASRPNCRSAPLHLPPMRCVSACAACQRPWATAELHPLGAVCGRDREALMAMDGPLWSESRHPYPGIRAPNWVRLPLVLLGLTHASAVTRSSCIRCAPSPSCASNPLPSVAAGHHDAFPIRPLATHPRARLALGQTRPTIARYTALASAHRLQF